MDDKVMHAKLFISFNNLVYDVVFFIMLKTWEVTKVFLFGKVHGSFGIITIMN